MLRVRVNEALPGMMLASPVYHPRSPGTLLLQPGHPLEAKAIRRLRELRVPEVWIECPGLTVMAQSSDPAVQEARSKVATGIAAAFDAAASATRPELDYHCYREAIVGLLDKLSDSPGTEVFITELASAGFPAIRHAASTAYLAVLIGLKLDFYLLRERPKLSAAQAKDVTNLGVAAMLHDIGMTRLPEDVLLRWNKTLDESDEAWREHARLGYKMVSGQIEPTAAAAVLHHHQRYDGSGFPAKVGFEGDEQPVAGRDIHVFARIVAAADVFDRLVHPASAPLGDQFGHDSRPAVRALRMIQGPPYVHWIDPVVLSGLLAVVPPYAPGTIVRLSDGRRCVVRTWSPTDPCRPRVAELIETDPAFPEVGEGIDLDDRPDLEIAEADGQDVRADNYYPDQVEHIDLDRLERSFHNRADTLQPGV